MLYAPPVATELYALALYSILLVSTRTETLVKVR